ncbi:hypothetical protein BDV27DRAFT_155405 [Aspergillus caelatus]|uniref:Apple domain-containing protein n=1 Tax=Aspergillus caelatus TaxID=61420 RepID=A0A5N7AAZ2_9EURO|nr:uncharacterized protein BDV27DRAFT_155405 [Aspergillus caelatus]KAE8367024.1 hypothetical protein BDV27DRAFT_155405 [Aspergillus caelatus]
MIFSPPLLSIFLSASATWATQAPLGSASGTGCLSLSSTNYRTTYDTCCSGGSTSGKGSVNGVEFNYSCGRWATGTNKTPIKGVDARGCAKHCAADTDCLATSWTPRGQCFLVTTQGYSTASGNNFLLMEKTGGTVDEPAPEGGCGKPVEAAKAQCEKEAAARCEEDKATLTQTGRVECEKKMAEKCNGDTAAAADALKAQCEQEKATLGQAQETECDRRIAEAARTAEKSKAQCEAEKATIGQREKAGCEKRMADKCKVETSGAVSALKTQLEKTKADITNDMENKCEVEKSNQAKEWGVTKAKLEAEKAELQTALDALKETNAGGTASHDGSDVATRLADVGPTPQYNICPQYGGREFTTTTSSGNTARWRVNCNMFVKGHWYVDRHCPPGSIVQILRERQENREYKGLFWNHVNICHEVIPTPGTSGMYLIKTPNFPNHAFIERID